MVVATTTTTIVASGSTQSTINTAIQTAMTAAGYSTLVDSFSSGGTLTSVYSIVLNSAKTYGTTYIALSLTSALALSQNIYSGWNASTHTGTGVGTASYPITLNNSYTVFLSSWNAQPEAGILEVVNNVTSMTFGLICPVNIPSWWDLNQWTYGFILTNTAETTLSSASNSPYANSAYAWNFTNGSMSGVNPINGRRDIVTGASFFSSSNNGCAGRTSDDIAMGAVASSTRGDSLVVVGSSTIYGVVHPIAGGLVMRTA